MNATTLALVVLEGGVSVALVTTGVGNGAVADEVRMGVTEAGLLVGGDDVDATIAEVVETTGAAVLEEVSGAMVWLALKPLGRVMPLSRAQVAGSSPLVGG